MNAIIIAIGICLLSGIFRIS